MGNRIDKSNDRLMVYAAILVIVGSMFSGPFGYLIVNLVNPIPWTDAPSFAAQYHPIQTLPYWFGFLYLAGFILFIAASRQLLTEKDRIFGDAALVTTSIFAALIGFNYTLQVGFIPNALEDPGEVFAAFAMNNPRSISWSIEMFGWGFLGASTWLISPAFKTGRLQRIARALLIINGVGSILNAVLASVLPAFVLQVPGLIAYFVWNAMIWVIMILIIADIRARQKSPR
jgi:hypothetical protein